jgi:hypothetical protein
MGKGGGGLRVVMEGTRHPSEAAGHMGAFPSPGGGGIHLPHACEGGGSSVPSLSAGEHVGSAHPVWVPVSLLLSVSLPITVMTPAPTPDGHIKHGQLAVTECVLLALLAS